MVATLDQLERLLAAEGRRLLAELPVGEVAVEEQLRLGSGLRRRYAADLVAAALTLRELRWRGRAKFGRAEEMFFTRAGLEQASGERLAEHRARRYRGTERLADLCAGIGGDLVALAAEAPTVAIDRDPLHVRMAELNGHVFGVDARVSARVADAQAVDVGGFDGVFVDPARRLGGGRTGAVRSEPPLAWCFGLAESVARVGIKAAPGLPHGVIPAGWEAEFVADGRELKEAALWSPAIATAGRRATVLPGGETLVDDSEEGLAVAAPGPFLLDPNPAVTRAGLVEELGRLVGAWQIDERIAFLATDRAVVTPFARTLRVVESMPWHQKAIASRLRGLDVGAVDIRRRGLAGDVEELRRRLRLSGSRRVTLVMTRAKDRPWCLVCEGVDG